MDRIEIIPGGAVHATIQPPGSKSITNRAFVCAALADGRSTLRGTLDSEDTQVMIRSLGQLGIRVAAAAEADHDVVVDGCGGRFKSSQADLFLANSGTSIRFLTALATLGRGMYRLDGINRMRKRPIGDLVRALNQLGADVRCESGNDCPPVVVQAARLTGGIATVRGDVSSQFLSALLMASPYATGDVELQIDGPLVSRPYVDMTTRVMCDFGVDVEHPEPSCFRIHGGQRYRGRDYRIEPDASAASYFWAAAAITNGRVTVTGLNREAMQGDVAFCDCLKQMGCHVEYSDDAITVTGCERLRGIDVNMNAISDTVQTLAAVALFADGPTTVTGVAHNRFKETDRIGDLICELRRLGADAEELDDGLRILPGALHAAEVATYNDHRMAMSLSLVGLRVHGVVITNPSCTDKTYPRFFDDLESIR